MGCSEFARGKHTAIEYRPVKIDKSRETYSDGWELFIGRFYSTIPFGD